MLGRQDLAEARRHWTSRFRLEHHHPGPHQEVPARVLSATENAWKGLATGGQDQLVPGLHAVGVALVVRNLALTLPGRPVLVVTFSDGDIARAYHRIENPILGRWASKYPLFFRGPEDTPLPLSRRGVSSPPPRPLVARAYSPDDLQYWARLAPGARFLFIADRVDDLPAERPEQSHALLRGVLARDRRALERVRRPCSVVAPGPGWELAPGPCPADLGAFHAAERNVAGFEIALRPVGSDETALARSHRAFVVLHRQGRAQGPAFVNICRLVLNRLSADLFLDDVGVDPEGRPTDALVALLRSMIRMGEAPNLPEARVFVGEAERALASRRSKAPPKATWLRSAVASDGFPCPDIVVDSKLTASRGQKELATSAVHARAHRYVRVLPFREVMRVPSDVPVLVASAPGPDLLQSLASGAVPRAEALLYPWEHGVFEGSRRYLQWCAAQLGASWPTLPHAPDVPVDYGDAGGPELQTRPRATVDLDALEDADLDEDEADRVALVDEDRAGSEGPRVVLTTDAGRHPYPPERVVLLRRARHFHELPAAQAEAGDTLVNYKGGSSPAARDVIAKVCRRDPLLERTRVLGDLWRRLLRDQVAKRFGDAPVAQVHRSLDVGVQYHQFRHWLTEGDPVTPERENLQRLMKSLGQPRELAEAIYKAGLDHKSDRRRIIDYLADLANLRLDELFKRTEATAVVDAERGLTIEDLLSVIQFEKVTKVAHNGS